MVQLYEDEAYLAEVVGCYVAAGLERGEPTLIIATPAHRSAFRERIAARGADVARAQADGRLVVLDARPTLARFMVDGRPDTSRFVASVGGIVRDLGRRGARVRAFGEMVDVLWADGNGEAALALEELWNALAEAQSFSLLCAYDLARFPGGDDGPALARVCGAHSHVIPAESYAHSGDDDARRREIAQLQQRARALEGEVAERKAIEARLRESLQQRDEFLAIAGHELKTPLTAAQLMMESLLRLAEEAGSPTLHERVAKATLALKRLGLLIDSLVDVTRLTGAPPRLRREQLDLAALVREVVEGAAPMLRGARCNVELGGDAQVRGRWDRLRLEQIANNLLSNACKYGAGQPIAIRVERAGERARLSVRDHGVGIAREDQARIFERFERARAKPHAWGLGLGLWIAQQAVAAHGGTIYVASEPGHGATFVVELPLG